MWVVFDQHGHGQVLRCHVLLVLRLPHQLYIYIPISVAGYGLSRAPDVRVFISADIYISA